MRFLIDRCAGRLVADWLRKQGHDVVESRELGPDPGDRALLEWAANEARILITIDTDFGQLVYVDNVAHAGIIRLPDVPSLSLIHISEPTRQAEISYAVFCLKKKNEEYDWMKRCERYCRQRL